MATRDMFSADELAQLRGFPEIGRAELIRFFMLTPADEEFVRRFRDKRNVLGASVQLCTLPWLGFVPEDVPAAPAAAVARLSERLGIPVGELRGYGTREQTRSDHLRDVAAYLGWHQVDRPRWKDLEEFLFARALEHDSPKLLFRLACEYLSSSRLVRPGVVLILERVATARKRARKETWERVEPMLTGFLRGELDGMLVPDPLLGRTRLAWLGTGPTSSAPAAVKSELEKLAYLRGMDAHTLDLSVLPAERRRFLAGLGRRLTAQNLSRRDDDRKYPILLTLAAQSAVDVLDEVLLLFDQALSRREAAAREKLKEVLAERAKGGEDRQALLDDILAIVLDPEVGDDQVGGRGIAVRLVLAALGQAAMVSGSSVIEFGTRNLALHAALGHRTVGRVLEQLRNEPDPLIDLVSRRQLARADRYQLRIPDRYADSVPWRRRRAGRIEAIHLAFLVLGGTAGLVYQVLGQAPARGAEVARSARLSASAVSAALHVLAEHGLAERGPDGWHRGPAALADIAKAVGAADLHRERAERYRQDRESWRARLRQYQGARGRRVTALDGWWSLDDPAEYDEMCRWPVILDDAVRAPPSSSKAEPRKTA